MFEPASAPRVFGLPPGADFAERLLAGIDARLQGRPPQALGEVEIIVNSARMARRIEALLRRRRATIWPRLLLLTDLPRARPLPDLPAALPKLRRTLQLSQLVARLLERVPDLAPRAAIYDLAESLGALIDEMHDEGVSLDSIASLDVAGFSAHWARARQMLEIVLPFSEARDDAIDSAARLRHWVEGQTARWAIEAPAHPVLVAGSTGSRGTTAMLMQAVARLPQGAVILPGFDTDLPQSVWSRLDQIDGAEDHPQDRFRRLMRQLDLRPDQIGAWDDAPAPVPARNRLVSLALRPAPVTDQWRSEAHLLDDPIAATAGLSLVEAPSARLEAAAIALCLRQAVQDGEIAAVVSPDRTLTRQVAAALDRWQIEPDDSAGQPLSLSAPGRLLRLSALLLGQRPDAECLIGLLKHPLVARGGPDRGEHLRHSRDLELWLRRNGPALPGSDALAAWSATRSDSAIWTDWVARILHGLGAVQGGPLADVLDAHLRLVEALVSGPTGGTPDQLWAEAAGRETRKLIDLFRVEAGHGGTVAPAGYADLLNSLLAAESVRETFSPHPDAMIWGTIEARVQSADLVILGGLNDGVWPARPPPDPWLNRPMRRAAGLTVPERRIGLQAHDFQQAIAARRAVLTRSKRDDEAQTVPSRWLNRLTNLLAGMGEQGEAALAAMRARGDSLLAQAVALDLPSVRVPRARRPAPCPPAAARPKRLSVTEIETLIRDPYAIYARHVLGLRPLDPLRRLADERERGTLLHNVLEEFVKQTMDGLPNDAEALLLRLTDEALRVHTDWPAASRLWRARLASLYPRFLEGEIARRHEGTPLRLEVWGETKLASGLELFGKADRIDRLNDGRLALYDYKTGAPPSTKEALRFNRQLHLEAILAEDGGFSGVPATKVGKLAFLGLAGKTTEFRLEDSPDMVSDTRDRLERILARYGESGTGYLSRRAMHKLRWPGDFDHLARHGEWDDSDSADPGNVA